MSFLYPTASTIAVFLNGYHIEQAYQIQHKETVNKIPIYGYSDHRFSKVALGRQMVQGVLVVNFIFAGYLNTILDSKFSPDTSFVSKLHTYDLTEHGEGQKKRLIDNIKQELRTELPPNQDAETRSARAAYIASLLSKDKATREATKKALEAFNTEQDPGNTSIVNNTLDSPLTLNNQKVTLDIYYQDPEYTTWFLRFKNVHFYEVSQIGSMAGSEGSSDPLYEVYSFMASEKEIKLVGEIQ